MALITVENNQSIWDLAYQYYGSTEGVRQLIIDNPTKVNFNDKIPAGTTLIISQPPINKAVVDFFQSKGITPSTAIDVQPVSNWILAAGAWNDGGIWIDTELWNDN